MSTGHHHTEIATQTELKEVLGLSSIKARLAQPFVYDFGYDIPYLCGYSKDAKTVYVDRHLPRLLKIQGKNVAILRFLNLHERLEKACIDLLHKKYYPSHRIATRYEHNAVIAAYLSPHYYELALRPYIKADEHEKIKRIPADLDWTPYIDSHDHALIVKMRRAMV